MFDEGEGDEGEGDEGDGDEDVLRMVLRRVVEIRVEGEVAGEVVAVGVKAVVVGGGENVVVVELQLEMIIPSSWVVVSLDSILIFLLFCSVCRVHLFKSFVFSLFRQLTVCLTDSDGQTHCETVLLTSPEIFIELGVKPITFFLEQRGERK